MGISSWESKVAVAFIVRQSHLKKLMRTEQYKCLEYRGELENDSLHDREQSAAIWIYNILKKVCSVMSHMDAEEESDPEKDYWNHSWLYGDEDNNETSNFPDEVKDPYLFTAYLTVVDITLAEGESYRTSTAVPWSAATAKARELKAKLSNTPFVKFLNLIIADDDLKLIGCAQHG
jgi:hypothetical protein